MARNENKIIMIRTIINPDGPDLLQNEVYSVCRKYITYPEQEPTVYVYFPDRSRLVKLVYAVDYIFMPGNN